MSRQNLEIVKGVFAAWNAGDMAAYREVLDPEVILRSLQNWPEQGPWVGPDAAMRQFEHVRDTWDSDTVDPITEFVDIADQVVVRWAWHTTGGHGPDTGLELTSIYTVRRGKVVMIEFFWDHAEALEAVGLSE
jgi:ketosteroid isomerase-like protein